MRRTLLGLAGCGTVAVLACSGGGGGSGLSSGAYSYSGSVVSPDGCKLPPAVAFNNVTQTITVNGPSIVFDVLSDPVVFTSAASFTATLVGASFQAPTVSHRVDWSSTAAQVASGLTPLTRGYPCVEADLYDVKGFVNGANAFQRTTDVRFTMAQGTAGACAAAYTSEFGVTISFPCDSVLSQQAAKR